MTMHLESTYGANGCRRYYKSDAGPLIVEITTVNHDKSDRSCIMSLWVKHGLVPEFLETTLGVHTYYHKENGDCLGIYNPTLAYEEYYVNHGDVPIKRYRPEINPEWELEATSENEQKILDECERLMIEARMMEN